MSPAGIYAVATEREEAARAVAPAPSGSVLAITSQVPWPLDSGGHLRSYHLLRALAGRFRVRLVTTAGPGQEAAADALGRCGIAVRAAMVGPRTRWGELVRGARAALRGEPYVLYRRHDREQVRKAVEAEIARDPPDILYLDHLDSLLFRRAAGTTPAVVDLHNVYSRIAWREAREGARRTRGLLLRREAILLERIERRAAAVAGALLTVSEEERLHFAELGASHLHVVPNGVDCAKYADLPAGRRSGPPVLLYIGAMSWAPNAAAARFLATEVLPRVRATIPDATLRIVGRDPPPDVRALGGLTGVEVTGGVPDVIPYLRDAHVLAVPLEVGGGTRLKILEAFAAGLPVVSTPVGCEGLGVRDGQDLVIAERDRFAEACVGVLGDAARANRLAERGRALVRERFDWASVGEAACRAVSAAIARSRPRSPARRPVRVLELRSALGQGGGPEKTILLGAARADRERFPVTVCYIRDVRDEKHAIGARAAQLGVDYVEVREAHSFDVSIWPALRRLVRERRIDLVHAHDYKTDLIALALARTEGVIPLATSHGWIRNTSRERLYYALDLRLLARYPVAITVSEPIRRTLIDAGADPGRVQRIRNGVDHVFFRRNPVARERIRGALGIEAGALVLGAIGRLGPEKRFDVLVEAAARLAAPLAPLVVIAGEGRCRPELEAQAAACGLGDRLRLLGHRTDVREVHQAFDIYVQTSDTEGIPNAILEAMALETPIIATDVGGTGELIDDGIHGLLVPAGDPGAVSRAIERTLADRGAASRRVASARERIERELSFDARMEAVESIYGALAARFPDRASRRRSMSLP